MTIRGILRYLLLFFCYSNIALFLILTIIYVFFDATFIGFVVGIIYPMIAPLLCLIYIVSGIIIIRFSFMKNRVGALTLIIIVAFMLIVTFIPYTMIPYKASDADNQLFQTYGAAYTNLDTANMRPVVFSIYDSFFGVPIDEGKFSVESNIRYLNNGYDSFYFDWYKPLGEGPFPVIIAIHGGGWVIGDKAGGNMLLFNKYFASKGYVVFDLQYGVYNASDLTEMGEFSQVFSMISSLITPNYNLSYGIQQQLENIAYFTKVLEANRTKYHADLNRTFIAGRSAGGHMASIVTLGYKNPLFAGNFSSLMNITAGIWFYPPTNLTKTPFFDKLLVGSAPLDFQYKKFSAAFLIKNSTVVPPIMMVMGDKDGVVGYQANVEFQAYAKSLNKTCIFVTIPWGGHAFDLDFQTYGGQMSTYYIERFMALELGG
ncbi:MAG: alpha/beta hydrolase [Candidatus Helarchaeota archaeon]|nr:alpha/beta hydrolase [Candidatus Helarchaeota archaeon]